MWKHRLGILGGAFFLVFVFIAIFGPWITPEDYSEISLKERHRKPFWLDRDEGVGWLGTDVIGRDIASGIILGARISMLVGVSVTLLYLILNVGPGLVAAYYGGWVDDVIMRIADMNAALPPLVLLLAVMAFLGQGVMNLIIFFGISAALSASRVTRGEVFRAKNMEYVLAARSVGAGDMRIMVRHILPNVMAPLIVGVTLGFGWIILGRGQPQLPRVRGQSQRAVVGPDAVRRTRQHPLLLGALYSSRRRHRHGGARGEPVRRLGAGRDGPAADADECRPCGSRRTLLVLTVLAGRGAGGLRRRRVADGRDDPIRAA